MAKKLKLTPREKPQPKEFVPYESDEQKSVVRWAKDAQIKWPELALLYAVPNGAMLGGKNRFAQVNNLKAQGLRVGVPDLVLPVARGDWFGAYLEMKRLKDGVWDVEQKWWADKLKEQGYLCGLARGHKAGIDFFVAYLSKPKTVAIAF